MRLNKMAVYASISLAITPGLCGMLATPMSGTYDIRQNQSFTPPHKKNSRGKFKRSGR